VRVQFIQAAVHYTHVERAQPLALARLAAVLRRERNDQVALYDMRLDWKNFVRPLQVCQSFHPDVVGISAHGVDAPAMYRLAAAIKEELPATKIIAGGIHATTYWREAAANPHIDYVVIGEGEHTLGELLTAIETDGDPQAIPGLAFRRNGEVHRCAERAFETDLDRFPFPAWDLVDFDAYGRFQRIGLIYKHHRYVNVETARGCPYHCAWCHRSMGGVPRMHSADYVLSMFAQLHDEYGLRDFMIIDDLFNFSTERVEAICEGIIERRWNIGITIPIGFRADLATDRQIELLARAGVYRIMVAIETASPRLQREMGKRLNLERTREVIALARRHGISVHGNLILGLPDETEQEMRTTIRYATTSKLDTFGLYRAVPFQGTRLYEEAREKGLPVPEGENFFSFWESELNLSPVPLRRINRLCKTAIPYFYFRPGRLFRLLFKLPHSFRQFPYLVWFFLKKIISW